MPRLRNPVQPFRPYSCFFLSFFFKQMFYLEITVDSHSVVRNNIEIIYNNIPCTLYLVACKDNTLQNYSTKSQPGEWHWHSQDTKHSYHNQDPSWALCSHTYFPSKSRPHTVCFHLYEMSRIFTAIETESRVVFTRAGKEGNGEWLLMGIGIFLRWWKHSKIRF